MKSMKTIFRTLHLLNETLNVLNDIHAVSTGVGDALIEMIVQP